MFTPYKVFCHNSERDHALYKRQTETRNWDSHYSIIIDESTDVGTIKLMAYCVRYYNSKLKKIVTDFLGLQLVVRARAIDLIDNFEKFITEFGLSLEKMIAIATDGASNLCGRNLSLFKLLKAKYPKLVLLQCICHSLNKCAEKACQELPSTLEFLLRETRNWFSYSSLRKYVYSSLYQSIVGKEPPKLTTLSNTRWLSFNKAVKQNIDQWQVLRNHFAMIVKESEKDPAKKCYTAHQLSCMYEDRFNYLSFIRKFGNERRK